MNVSTPKNLNSSNTSNASSASQHRLSYLKPPQPESKGPFFLQQTKVNLYVPKHDNDLPDYSNSPVILSEEQHSARSLAHISGMASLDQSLHSSLTKASNMRRDTISVQKGGPKSSLIPGRRSASSNPDVMDVFQENKLRNEKRYKKIENFLENKWVSIYMIIITLYALSGEELGILSTSNNAYEPMFDTLSLICVSSFMIELVLNFIAKREYRWSFFFYIDFVSTVSMLMDLSFIPSEAIDVQADSTQIARAARVSKIGARAGRFVRVFKIFKIAESYQLTPEKIIGRTNSNSIQSLTNLVDNIAKLKRKAEPISNKARPSIENHPRMKGLSLKEGKGNDEGPEEKTPLNTHYPRRPSKFATLKDTPEIEMSPMNRQRSEPHKTLIGSVNDMQKMTTQLIPSSHTKDKAELPKESRVGKLLSQMTIKRVVLIVLILLILVPMLSADAWADSMRSYNYDVDLIKSMIKSGSLNETEQDMIIWDIINRHTSTTTPIIYFQLPNGTVIYETDPIYTSIRTTQVEIFSPEDLPGLIVAIDLSLIAKVTAATTLGRTIFICLILGLGALLFSKDANDLVLRPLERMVEKVNRIAISPLSVKRENLLDDSQKKNETTLLENAIIKIGTLLALGFGDAGAEIIAQNISQAGDMDPMLSGEKIMAIFGFCDIRNFTDATEVLQEDVMVFVNSIAEIVHDKVDKYGGSANKNIGDAFLLVWKFPRSETEEMDDELQLKNTDLVKGTADLALFSFLKIFAKINQSPVLKKYRSNPKLLERLPNYRVKMGFGLHVGWAIEGAIGSEYKIDASYLSPNVNIASRLEAATKQYGVPLLISHDLFLLFSDEVQKYCRKIDIVTLKGSQFPTSLYTVDLDTSDLKDKAPSKRQKKDRIRRHELKKQKLSQLIWEGKLSTHLLFEKDKDLSVMIKKVLNDETKNMWEEGIEAYVNGDWKRARLMFDKCLVIKEKDGPSCTLLNYMKSLGYHAPIGWKGFRELTEK